MPLSCEFAPPRKARELVNDVIVMEGPAFLIAIFIRFIGDRLREVWSSELHMTNISSTPIPIIRIGIALCASFSLKPSNKPNKFPV